MLSLPHTTIWLASLLGITLIITGICLWYAQVRIRRLTARTRQLEQQVEYRTRQAEDAHHIKELFLTNVSHEIRTPMNGLLGMASLLSQTALNKEQNNFVENIRSCGDTLLTVINNILDFSAIETGKITLDEKVTDLRSLVQEVMEIFISRTSKAGIQLHYELSPDLPNRVITDKGRLRQILINLVGNAVKFTQQGEVRIRIAHAAAGSIQTKGEQIGLSFEVSDTGSGIDAEYLGQLHQFFSRTDPAAQPYGSTGLGLILSDRLVHLLNGRIRVFSEPGKGSQFIFTILAKPAPVKSAPNTADALPRLAEKYPLRILLAEDNPINRQLAVLILDKMGYSCGVAENGKEVLDQLQKEPFDLIFMDIQMPEMDGLEATRHIRRGRGKQPVIIAMTANTTRKDRDDCLTEGMNDFLSKPVHLDELIRMMETWGQTINGARELQAS
ncbi:MAG TPA: response regulator [Puia sp.]|jgi:signal transduction histidine kinase/CheY-like chemotaxis protein|nr:response regulator [Puia sp.]